MPAITSSFLYATCREGSARALKEEVKRTHGDLLTPAYMRPQLITWKAARPLTADFNLRAIYGRTSGLSLGMAADADAVAELVRGHGTKTPWQVHVSPQQAGEDGVPTESWAVVDTRRARLIEALEALQIPHIADPHARPKAGDMILDVILEDEPTRPMLVGVRCWREDSAAHPGGLPRLTLPAEAPSRAWLKLEQALAWLGYDTPGALRGRRALEFGCSPGGAAYALLQRGASVVGVDPGEVSPALSTLAAAQKLSFTHEPISIAEWIQHAKQEPLPHFDLLLSDMNLAPPVVLHYLEQAQPLAQAPLLILTLKLNDAKMVSQTTSFLERLRRIAPGPIRATQLPANRSEICVAAGRLPTRSWH